ncbi:MAG: DUF4190 domain-containing protein [Saprospiraceae bacterium]
MNSKVYRLVRLGILICISITWSHTAQGLESKAWQISLDSSAGKVFEQKINAVACFVPQKKGLAPKILLSKLIKRHGKTKSGDAKILNLAILGFALSLGNLLLYFAVPFLTLPLSLAGIFVSIVALGKINKTPDKLKGKTFAILGIILGIAYFALFIPLIIEFVNLFD